MLNCRLDNDILSYMRTLTKDAINKIGETATLMGWVHARRDHGKLVFIDLRDRWGIVQAVFSPKNQEVFEKANLLRPEWVVKIDGIVKERPEGMQNPDLPTGKIEIEATGIEILAEAKTPPFPLDTAGYEIEEELRLKYRYLDLRRERLQKNLELRSLLTRKIRDYFYEHGFVEIETPLLTKSTPEGSRDFVVPSRLQPGKFYALPQSPQQYKQLLMVAGVEKYFQVARAVRDEDLRGDRGFEHTQVDFEMSFVEQQDVMRFDEELMISVMKALGYMVKEQPFPIFTYREAVEEFGSDKFDLRNEEEKRNNKILAFAWVKDFPFFEKDEKTGNWTYSHNPFSDPIPEHKEKFLSGEIEGILTTQYDLVCNGHEVGGGSIRSTNPKILKRVFEILGHTEVKIEKQFGHMLEAFGFGVPPHGGLAHGLDRLMMVLAGEEAMREVVAFPTTSGGKTSVMDAPSELDEKQLNELHLKINKK